MTLELLRIRSLIEGDLEWAEALIERELGGLMQAPSNGIPIHDELELELRL